MKYIFSILWSLFSLTLFFLVIETILNSFDFITFEKQYLGLVSLVLMFLILVLNALKREVNFIFQFIISLGFLLGAIWYYNNPIGFWIIVVVGIITTFLLIEGVMKGKYFHVGYYKSFSQREGIELTEKEISLSKKEISLIESKAKLKKREEKLKKKEDELTK